MKIAITNERKHNVENSLFVLIVLHSILRRDFVRGRTQLGGMRTKNEKQELSPILPRSGQLNNDDNFKRYYAVHCTYLR